MNTHKFLFSLILSLINIAPACFGIPKEEALGRALIEASKKGDAQEVESLIKQGANVEYKHWLFHETPLIIASEEGHPHVVTQLINDGANINNQDMYGKTALHTAAHYDHDDIVLLLLTHKARTDIKNKDGDTALHYTFDGFKGAKHNANTAIPAK